MIDENGLEYELSIVANIIGDHYWGEAKLIKSGTKHFRPGAKLYCVFMYGGMGHQQVRVMGKCRISKRWIDLVIKRDYIKNLRVQKVYIRRVIAFIQKHPRETNNSMISDREFEKMENEFEIKPD